MVDVRWSLYEYFSLLFLLDNIASFSMSPSHRVFHMTKIISMNYPLMLSRMKKNELLSGKYVSRNHPGLLSRTGKIGLMSVKLSSSFEKIPSITVFSISNCRFCSRAKSILNERSWPFVEINLDIYPEKRADMISLSDNLTVPQIFFGDENIGGCEELEQWFQLHQNESYDFITSNFHTTESRLSMPTERPVSDEKEQRPIRRGDAFNHLKSLLPSKKSSLSDYIQISERLKEEIPLTTVDSHKKIFSHEALQKFISQTITKDFVDETILEMEKFHMILPLQHSEEHSETLYQLYEHRYPLVLNSYRSWADVVDSNPMSILSHLQTLINDLQNKYRNNDTGLVDYQAMLQSDQMKVFEEATCELQHASLFSMSPQTKLAFCINLYNIMIKHAFAKVGIPTDVMNRGPFFENVGYWLAGGSSTQEKVFLSFSELENGILRGNRIAPGKIKPFFENGDTRIQAICSNVDPRIHFALNCGAKSCPPIRKFTTEAIDEELRIVSMAFCQSDENVKFDSTQGKLYLNQIFNWYGIDFGRTPNEIALTIVKWLRGTKKSALETYLKDGRRLKLEFLTYDWTSDAINPMPFNYKQNIGKALIKVVSTLFYWWMYQFRLKYQLITSSILRRYR